MFGFRRKIIVSVTTVFAAASLLASSVAPATATESPSRVADITEAVLQFDVTDNVAHAAEFELDDGTQVRLGAEPVMNGLDGTWHVWGDNAAFRMEYYVTYQSIAGTPYTRVVGNPYGFKVVSRIGLAWDSPSLSAPRAAETATFPSLTEGGARFHYPFGAQTGGVRATVKNSTFSATLW